MHRNRFLGNKTNRCTEFQFFWYYYSTCFGQPFCPSSGVLSLTSALVHFTQLWPFATRSRIEFQPTPGSKRSSQLHKMYQSWCMAKNSWWWAERLPKTCRVVIPIKLEFSASVGFIHKESVTMHGHTVTKLLRMHISFTLIHKLLLSCLKDNILISFNTWAKNSVWVNKWTVILSFLYSSCSYSSNTSWDSIDYVVTMLPNGQLRNLGLIPGRGKRFSFVQSIHTNSGATQPSTQRILGDLFPRGWGVWVFNHSWLAFSRWTHSLLQGIYVVWVMPGKRDF